MLSQEQKKQPWYKKHPLMSAGLATAGLVGGGLLASKLLRGGNVTSQTLEATKPVDIKPVDIKPVDVKPVDIKPVDVKPVDVKPVAPSYVAPDDAWFKALQDKKDARNQLAMYDGDFAGEEFKGGNPFLNELPSGKALFGGLAGQAVGGSLVKGVGGGVARVAGPALSARAWANNAPVVQAMSEFYGWKPETTKNIVGGMGGTVNTLSSALTGFNPYITAALQPVVDFVPNLLSKGLLNPSAKALELEGMDTAIQNPALLKLMQAVRNGDHATIARIKQLLPTLASGYKGNTMEEMVNKAYNSVGQ